MKLINLFKTRKSTSTKSEHINLWNIGEKFISLWSIHAGFWIEEDDKKQVKVSISPGSLSDTEWDKLKKSARNLMDSLSREHSQLFTNCNINNNMYQIYLSSGKPATI